MRIKGFNVLENMFCQLKNSVRHVHINPCKRIICNCYQRFKADRDKQQIVDVPLQIPRTTYYEYAMCYKQSGLKNNEKDVFLL